MVNTSDGGEGTLGSTWTLSTRLKMYDKQCTRHKPIYQYSLNGDFIKEWHDVYSIEALYGIKYKKGVLKACKGLRNIYKGYQWKYYK